MIMEKLSHWFDSGRARLIQGVNLYINRNREQFIAAFVFSVIYDGKKSIKILKKMNIDYKPALASGNKARSVRIDSDSTPVESKERQALKCFNRALDNWRKFQVKRGAEFYGGKWEVLRKFDKALLDTVLCDLNSALRLNEHFCNAYELRAQVWEQKLDYEKACEDWEKAIELSPSGCCVVPSANGHKWMYTFRLDIAKKKRKRKGKISGFFIDRFFEMDPDGKCISDDTFF